MDKLNSNFLKLIASIFPVAFSPSVGEFFNINQWVVSTIMMGFIILFIYRLATLISDWSKDYQKKDANVSQDEVEE